VTLHMRRSAGVLLPLSSVRSETSWGVGEFPDIGALAPWLQEARLSVWMMLPLLEAGIGQDSPYSALSAFALDPLYISLDQLPDFQALGGEAALDPDERAALQHARTSPSIDYPTIRRLKSRWLRHAFERFKSSASQERVDELSRFREEESGWLQDYSLFRALKEDQAQAGWMSWDPPLRDRDPEALAAAGARCEESRAFFEYVQWVAFRQLAFARDRALGFGVHIAGDLPFMVAEDSADVWSRRDIFRLDATVGVPPDAYSDEGQDWGLPVYRWDVLADRGYDWLRERARQSARHYDLLRIDHIVGFYRTYARPRDGSEPFFIPAEEAEQRAQGEAVLEAFTEAGVEVVAEDLGTVPPFVRDSLAAVEVPGYRVLRWESDDGVFRDPAGWPERSLATTGTHDTSSAAVWWDSLEEHERKAIRALPALGSLRDEDAARFGPAVRDAILEAVYGSRSALLILPVQDLFGATERINLPGTVGPHNWSYRLPWSISQLVADPFIRERTRALADLAERHGR